MAGLTTPYGIKIGKAACCGAVVLCSTGILLYRWRKKSVLKKKAIQKRNEETLNINHHLANLNGDDVDERKRILRMDAESLIAAMQRGELTPEKALHSYLYKACLVTQDLNCVTGIIKDAEAVAAKLSKVNANEHKLYGLPVSLKESLETKGMDSTVGIAQFIDDPAVDDSVIAKVLKHCGAVPFVKTNLSQLMASFESSNPVFGATVHPLNPKFTTGGSSSGEGALIAAGGSLLGFGTDTGGSIRCPSHICGIAGLLPTLNRISCKGLKGLHGQIGPMARDVGTLVLGMRALLCPLMFELDIEVPPLPFNEEIYQSKAKLRIGYYEDDGYLKPAPAITRAVAMTKEALERAGHTLVPFKVPRIAEGMLTFMRGVFGDGDRSILTLMRYEQVDPILRDLFWRWTLPGGIRWIISTLIGFKWPRVAQDLYDHGGGNRSVTRLRKIENDLARFKKDVHDAWRASDLDALICPPFPVVAGTLGSLKNGAALWSYTGLFNCLHYPAGVLPVTKVNEADMEALKQHKGHYDDLWDKNVKKICEGSLGMPVGVQCVALPFSDETVLRVMKEIETLLST